MLTVEHLSLKYPDGTHPLTDVSFALANGESVALIGNNGAGKTTLLLALAGVLKVSGGETSLTPRRCGLVFQNPDDQLFMPTIYEDLAFGVRNRKLPEENAARALETLGISHLAERSPLKLSGGEKRLCALASVLAMEPELLLLDEPTAFLDPRSKRRLLNVLAALPQGKLIATHDLGFAAQCCTRVLLLKDGTVTDCGAVTDETMQKLEAALSADD